MAVGGVNFLETFKRCAVALFALAQLMPSGLAVAAEDGDFSIVICTVDGLEEVSWADFTGEPAPAGPHQGDGGGPCHACVSSCRGGDVKEAADLRMTHPSSEFETRLARAPARVPIMAPAFSPGLSRAPPLQR